MTHDNATPRPWKTEMTCESDMGLYEARIFSTHEIIAKVYGENQDIVESNASLIVTAVNSHDELRENNMSPGGTATMKDQQIADAFKKESGIEVSHTSVQNLRTQIGIRPKWGSVKKVNGSNATESILAEMLVEIKMIRKRIVRAK